MRVIKYMVRYFRYIYKVQRLWNQQPSSKDGRYLLPLYNPAMITLRLHRRVTSHTRHIQDTSLTTVYLSAAVVQRLFSRGSC